MPVDLASLYQLLNMAKGIEDSDGSGWEDWGPAAAVYTRYSHVNWPWNESHAFNSKFALG